jgi:exportin-1
MNEFKMLPDSWTYCDMILNKSNSLYTRIYALIILEDLIKSKWNLLNPDQKLGIRNFLVDLLIKNVTDENTYSENQAFINKLNMNIVQVLSSLLRSLNKNGPLPGLTSSVRSALQVKPIRIFVKIT